MPFGVVAVFVALAMPQLLGALVMGVFEMVRHFQGYVLGHVLPGRLETHVGRVGFRAAGKVGDDVAKVDPHFRHADPLRRLVSRHGKGQGELRASIS